MTAVDCKLAFNIMTYNDSGHMQMLRRNKHSRIKNNKNTFLLKN